MYSVPRLPCWPCATWGMGVNICGYSQCTHSPHRVNQTLEQQRDTAFTTRSRQPDCMLKNKFAANANHSFFPNLSLCQRLI